MNIDSKVLIGIAIGLLAALGIGFIAFKAGQISTTNPPEQTYSTQVSSSTVPDKTIGTKPEDPEKLPDGQVKVSGSFREGVAGLFPNALVFTTTTSATNIPKGTGFYFSNYSTARSLLKIADAGKLGYPGCDYISGTAEIIISDYKPADTSQSENVNSAKIISVTKVVSPAQCGKGSNN